MRLVFETLVTDIVSNVLCTQGNEIGDMNLIFFVIVSCDIFGLRGGVYQIYVIKKDDYVLCRVSYVFVFFTVWNEQSACCARHARRAADASKRCGWHSSDDVWFPV